MPNCLLGALIMYSLLLLYVHTHIYQVHFRRSSRSLFLWYWFILGLGNPFRDTRSVSSFTTTTTTTIYSADCNALLLLLNSFLFLFFLFSFSRKLFPVPQSLIISRIFRQYGFFYFPLTYLLNLCDGWDETVFFFFNILMLLLLFFCLIFFLGKCCFHPALCCWSWLGQNNITNLIDLFLLLFSSRTPRPVSYARHATATWTRSSTIWRTTPTSTQATR